MRPGRRLVCTLLITPDPTRAASGQSIFGFLCRVGGTLVAVVCSFIAWYIVDGKTPGIIVFLWLFLFIEVYFLLKFPRFIQAGIITMITQILILGYELQVRKIGTATAEKGGQPAYP